MPIGKTVQLDKPGNPIYPERNYCYIITDNGNLVGTYYEVQREYREGCWATLSLHQKKKDAIQEFNKWGGTIDYRVVKVLQYKVI
jgi:sporulation protein YlmC with PRC-barrel domain